LAAPRKAGLWLNIMASKSSRLNFALSAKAILQRVAEMQSSRAVSCFVWNDGKRITLMQFCKFIKSIVVEAAMPSVP